MRVVRDLDQMKVFAQELVKRFGPRQVLLLDGAMGAGKTQLTRFILEDLGSQEAVSPSFAIHNEYETQRGTVDHVDLFRLENEDELESTGFWDLFAKPAGLIIIEWAERLPAGSVPRSWQRIALRLEAKPDGSREIIEI